MIRGLTSMLGRVTLLAVLVVMVVLVVPGVR